MKTYKLKVLLLFNDSGQFTSKNSKNKGKCNMREK